MYYKWRPSATQRRAFAERMQNPEEKASYEARKKAKEEKRRADSKYNYESAGGFFNPTELQYNSAWEMLSGTDEQRESANQIIVAHDCQMTVHHDYIHVVNEFIRNKERRNS